MKRSTPALDPTVAWSAIVAEGSDEVPLFDPTTVTGLPSPAQRFLVRTLPEGTPLRTMVQLRMNGAICIKGRWLPFEADQLLRAGVGFVWRPVVGRRLIRFVGSDVLSPTGAQMEFFFHGRIPVVRATGSDIARSAAGRLAAETVAWVPQALTPQCGARWVGLDGDTARVGIAVPGDFVDVEVTIGADGSLRQLALDRWGDPDGDDHAVHRFGGRMDGEYLTPEGVRIAGRGSVGWWFGTPRWADGEFFRFTITDACRRDPEAARA
jgi:hypothetical protein